MQFRLIVVSILLKTCVKDRGSRLLISCKAVKRGLQFAIFFVNFVLTNGTVSYYSRYCLQVVIVLIHVYNWEIQHHSTVCRCGLADIFFFFFFTGFMCSSRNSCPRGVKNRISLEAAMLRWCYSCKKSEASSINTEFERLLKIVGSSYPHSLPERSLHFHSLHQPILLFFSSRSIPVEGKLRLSNLQLPNLFYSIKNPTFVTTGTGLE